MPKQEKEVNTKIFLSFGLRPCLVHQIETQQRTTFKIRTDISRDAKSDDFLSTRQPWVLVNK